MLINNIKENRKKYVGHYSLKIHRGETAKSVVNR